MTKYFLLFLGALLMMGAQTKKTKKSPDQLNIEALRFLEAEMYDSAIVVFTDLIKIDPTYPDAYYNRGGCKQYVNNHHGAIFDFDHAIKLNPKDADCFYSRGLSKYEIKAFRGARDDFSKVIKLKPQFKEAYFDRAFCEKELGLFNDACDDFHISYDRGIKEAKKNSLKKFVRNNFPTSYNYFMVSIIFLKSKLYCLKETDLIYLDYAILKQYDIII